MARRFHSFSKYFQCLSGSNYHPSSPMIHTSDIPREHEFHEWYCSSYWLKSVLFCQSEGDFEVNCRKFYTQVSCFVQSISNIRAKNYPIQIFSLSFDARRKEGLRNTWQSERQTIDMTLAINKYFCDHSTNAIENIFQKINYGVRSGDQYNAIHGIDWHWRLSYFGG